MCQNMHFMLWVSYVGMVILPVPPVPFAHVVALGGDASKRRQGASGVLICATLGGVAPYVCPGGGQRAIGVANENPRTSFANRPCPTIGELVTPLEVR